MKRALLLGTTLLACQHEPPDTPVTVVVPHVEPSASNAAMQSPPPDPPRPGADPMLGPRGTQPFDNDAAMDALRGADLSRCFVPGAPSGHGRASITFDPSGRVASVSVDAGPFAGTPIGDCVAKVYSTTIVSPFIGAPARVAKSFTLQ